MQPKVYLPDLAHPVRQIGPRQFNFGQQVAVMAIINRTPDSFFDAGRTYDLDAARAAVAAAVEQGADWVDIGGQPFAPGPEISVGDELDRVIPLIDSTRADHPDTVISVDTYRPDVARQAIGAGAHVINDTSALHDLDLADVVAGSSAHLVITHSLAAPRTAHPRPAYEDVVAEVAGLLVDRVDAAISRGVPRDRIIIDPGHDLNKNTHHSLALTRGLSEITSLGYPTLVAVSNKDFIGETLDRPLDGRSEGTVATLTVCIMLGARIVRVHDVAQAVAAARMTEAIVGIQPPAGARHNLA